MKIIKANKTHKEKVKKLWEIVFPEDSQAYLAFYFDHVFPENQVLMAMEEDQLIGMLHINPYSVADEKKTRKIGYIVAVATHPQFRRRGVMGSLLQVAEKTAVKNGLDALFILPEDERYYGPFGYAFVSKQYNTRICSFLYESLKDIDVEANQLKDAKDLVRWLERQKYVEKPGESLHTKEYIYRLYRELSCEGGEVYTVDGNLVLFYNEDVLDVRRYYIKEADKEEEIRTLQRMAAWLVQKANGKEICFHEVNKPKLSKVFPYSKKNNYDVRPYMMKKDMGEVKFLQIYFDEVV